MFHSLNSELKRGGGGGEKKSRPTYAENEGRFLLPHAGCFPTGEGRKGKEVKFAGRPRLRCTRGSVQKGKVDSLPNMYQIMTEKGEKTYRTSHSL